MANYLSALPALQTQVPDIGPGVSYLASIPDQIRQNRMEDEKMNLLKQATTMKQEEHDLTMQDAFGKWFYGAASLANDEDKWNKLRTKVGEYAGRISWLDDPGEFANRDKLLQSLQSVYGKDENDSLTSEMKNAEYFAKLPPGDARLQYAPGKREGLSVTEKKEIFNSEDEVANLQATTEALGRALSLNEKTFTGYTAGVRGAIGSKLPDAYVPDILADKSSADATAEWGNIMSMEAIKTMANTLKGATTDFELNKFVEILADPSTPAPVRKRTIERMLTLAQRKQQILEDRMSGVRDRTYFAPQGAKDNSGFVDPTDPLGIR